MASVAIPGRRARGALTVRTFQDRGVIRDFLENDRLFAAYALCDLEDREFARTRWGAAFDGDEMVSIVLEYSGMTPQPMFVMGRDDGIEAILSDVIRPRAAYVAALLESVPAVQTQYRVDPGPPMVRMWVDRARFRPYPADARRLLPIEIGLRPAGELEQVGNVTLAPRGTEVRIPAHDVTPAELIGLWITGEGPRRPPFANVDVDVDVDA